MILQPLLTKLCFDATGRFLFHAGKQEVRAWHLGLHQLAYSCAGQWIGRSRTNETFLTCVENTQFRAWSVQTGAELPLESVDPASYAPHERFVVYGFPWPYEFNNPAPLVIHDAFGQLPPQTIKVQRRMADWPEVWAMVPHRHEVLVTMYAMTERAEWAYGKIIDLATGRVIKEPRRGQDFFAATFSPPVVRLDPINDQLISSAHGEFYRYSLENGAELQHFRVNESHGMLLALHPREPWLAATNIRPINSGERKKYAIGLLDLRSTDSWMQPMRTLPERSSIEDLAFHPGGIMLACLLSTGTIKLWNIDSGRDVGALKQRKQP